MQWFRATGPRVDAGCGRAGRLRRGRSTAGLSLVETTAALALLAFGALAVLGTMVYSLQLDATNHETLMASQAARRVLEQIRAEAIEDVLVLYDADGDDDPEGVDTAPGDTFAVTLLEQAVGGMGVAGEVVLPFDADGVLRETADIPELGLPRDLNGDGLVTSEDRSGDLIALPVLVRVRWSGINGEREISYRTVLR